MIAGKEQIQFKLDFTVSDASNSSTYKQISIPKGKGCIINILGIKIGRVLFSPAGAQVFPTGNPDISQEILIKP